MKIKDDFGIYTVSSLIIFFIALLAGYVSDRLLHLTGVQLVIVTSIITFTSRFVILKKMGFGVGNYCVFCKDRIWFWQKKVSGCHKYCNVMRLQGFRKVM